MSFFNHNGLEMILSCLITARALMEGQNKLTTDKSRNRQVIIIILSIFDGQSKQELQSNM